MTTLTTPTAASSVRLEPAALVAALGYAAEGAIVIARNAGWSGGGHLLDAAYAVAMIATAVAVPPVVRRIGIALPRATAVTTGIAQAGLTAMGVESAVGAVHRVDALGFLFTIGILLTVVGFLVLATLGLARGSVRRLAPLPLLGMVVAAAGGGIGTSLVTGALWLFLARRSALG